MGVRGPCTTKMGRRYPKNFNRDAWIVNYIDSYVIDLMWQRFPPRQHFKDQFMQPDGTCGPCWQCGAFEERKRMHADHIDPYKPVDRDLIWDMDKHTLAEALLERLERKLVYPASMQLLCHTCHGVKSKAENAARRKNGTWKKKKATGK